MTTTPKVAPLLVPADHVLAAARDLCAGLGDCYPLYVRGCAELCNRVLVGTSDVAVGEFKRSLIDYLGAPRHDPNGPLTDEQRSAIFASLRDAFGQIPDVEKRRAFISGATGRPLGEASLASKSPHTITYGEASRVLDLLSQIIDLKA